MKKYLDILKSQWLIIKADLILLFKELKKSRIQTKIFLILIIIITYLLLLPEDKVSNNLTSSKNEISSSKTKPKIAANKSKSNWERVRVKPESCRKIIVASSVKEFVSAKLSVSMQSVKIKGIRSSFPFCSFTVDTPQGVRSLVVDWVFTDGNKVSLRCTDYDCRLAKPNIR